MRTRSGSGIPRARPPAREVAWLVDLRRQIGGAAGGAIPVSTYQVERVGLTLKRGLGQGPPRILAKVTGLEQVAIYTGQPPQLERRQPATPFARTMEVALRQGHYVIVDASGAATPAITTPTPPAEVVSATGPLAGVHLQDVASQVGLDFRQGAFRFGVSADVQAMMGGGVCWLDYDNDGWLDLFVVNSYSEADTTRWEKQGGLPRTALFHNVKGSFVNVSKRSGADLPVRGEGCVAADFNGDSYTDLYVTTGSYDELLWNNGDGTFTEGAKAAGIDEFGWHSGAAVADVNGDGRPDLFVAGYTDLNTPIATAVGGFPTSYAGVRDLLYLNEGNDGHGRARFREVGVQAGLEAADFRHGLGAMFADYNGDGRPDLYVANDEDANQLYENVAWPGGAAADPAGLGFRFEERGVAEGVADPYAGMGIASGDYNGDGRLDLFVTNSRREPYAVLRRADEADAGAPAFDNGRSAFRSAAAGSAGWGASWVDLSLDGTPDLVLANGDIPVTSLSKDAARVQVLAPGSGKRYAIVGVPGLAATPDVNGRGLAAADYDNNGTVDVAVNSVGGRLVLLRNSGEKGHWLEVKLSTFSPGAVATAVLPDGRTLVDEEHAGSSYLSSEDPRLHFGLGSATTVRSLVVRFPGGRQTRLSNVRADRVVVVKPPSARPAAAKPAASYVRSNCTSLAAPTRSVARIWNDALLADDPGKDDPAEQARDLFHLSAAMWDAWDAYTPKGTGYFVTEKHQAGDALAARNAAISYAAYRLLLWRASYGPNMRQAFAHLTDTMRLLCYEPGYTSTKGDSPAALGNRVAAAAIAYGKADGSLESRHYLDPSYAPVNAPLVVSQPGTPMHDGTFWQPLAFGQITIQGGFPIPADVQSFVDSQWGHVRGFALRASKKGLPIDPGPPTLGGPSGRAYKQAAVDVIRASARPTGAAIVARWLAGHGTPARWNEIADSVSDSRAPGANAAARLASDVKLYFALDGALHDAAIASWGAKRTYDSVRPISMIRSLAFEGQSSDRKAPSYSPDGLPLVPGLVELVTKESSAPGQRHAALAGHVGDVAVRTTRGWVLGTRWAPRGGTVTPPSPGWVSDGSAFARAAAAVLTADFGSPRIPAGAGLRPWTTYRTAADEAGLAGADAGIQTGGDDLAGRRVGAAVGARAWALAQRYFAGTVR